MCGLNTAKLEQTDKKGNKVESTDPADPLFPPIKGGLSKNVNSGVEPGTTEINGNNISYTGQMQIPNMQGIPIPPQMQQITPVPPPQQEIMLPPPITTPQNSEEQHPKRPLPSLCNLVSGAVFKRNRLLHFNVVFGAGNLTHKKRLSRSQP